MNADIIQGDNGKISLMRAMTFIVVVSVMSVFVSHNIISMIKGGGFVSIGTQEAMLIAGVLASKAAQRFGEGKRPMEPVTTDDIPKDKGE